MASSSPSSDPSDAEDFNRENKSTLKLPGDCLPSEELPSCEEIILLEAMTPTVGSSGDFIRPVQGRWGPEGKKRWSDLQQLPLNDPKQIGKPGASVAWADNNGFEESAAHEKQCRGKKCPKHKTNRARRTLDGLVKRLNGYQSLDWNVEEIEDEEIYNHEKLQRKKDDCDFLEYTVAEDLRRSNCLPAQLSHQEHEVRLESAMRKPSGNTDVGPFPELPGTPKGQERAEKQCRGKKCPKHKTNRARRTLDGLVKRLNGYQSLDWNVEEIEDEEIYNHEKLQRKKDDCDFLEYTVAEDLRRSNCLPAQLSHQEHEVRLESAMRKPSGNTDVGPFPELPGTPKGQERAEKQCRGKKCPKHKTNRARRTLDGLVKRLNGYQSLDWNVEEIEDEEIYNHEKLQRKKDDCDFLEYTVAEDLRRSNCLPAQLSHQEHEVRLESAMRKPSGNTDVGPFPELPGTPKGQERAEKQCRGKKCPKHKTNRARRTLDGLVKRLNGYQSLDWNVEEIEDEEIYNHEKLQRKKDDCDFLEYTVAEDLRRSNCLPAQLSHQEHEVRLESAMRKPSGNTDVGPFPELPGTPKGQERAEKQCRGKKCPKHKTNRARRTLDGLVKRLNGYQSLDWNVEEIEDEEIYNHEKLQRKKDDCDFLEYTVAEDLRRSNCLPAQLSHQEHEVRLESAMRKPSGNTDVGPFPELPGTPKGQERAEKQCRGKKCPKHKTNRARRTLDGLVKRLNGYQSLDWNVEEIEDEEIYNHEKLQRKKDDCDFLKLTMAEDLRRSNCLPAQLSHQEHEVRLESAMRKPSGNTDVGPFPELPGTPKGRERAERAGEASSSHESGTTEPSTSSAHLEDYAFRPPGTASRLVGRAFRWLHRIAVPRGCSPEQATGSCPQRAPRGSGWLRGKRVPPDGPPGQFRPRMPTFSG